MANLALRLKILFHAQLGIKFVLLINVKIPIIVDILTVINRIDTTSKSYKARKS